MRPTMTDDVVIGYEPHPYALLLPALTADEFEALKADIDRHGILYPVIADEENRILDGVHRLRIAEELGIELPVARHEGLSDERKLHLAVGLNMRRRYLDADRRRSLVRELHKKEGLSVRKIAVITGWSKSTVDRDLQASPFESIVGRCKHMRQQALKAEDDTVRQILVGVAQVNLSLFDHADDLWKRNNWPPDDDEELLSVAIAMYSIRRSVHYMRDALRAKVEGKELPPGPEQPPWEHGQWDSDLDYRQELVEEARKAGVIDRLREGMSQMGHRHTVHAEGTTESLETL
jgi:hypothetical protein